MEPSHERSILAGEYALATLDEVARARAERLMAEDAAFRQEVWAWERRFARLGLKLPPVTPPPRIWAGVQQGMRQRGPTPSPRPARASRAVTAWAWMATAASMLLGVALVLQLGRPSPAPRIVTQRVEVPVPAVSYVALLQVPASTMQWAVSATPERGQLAVRASGEAPAGTAGFDAELWLITDDGPLSLGVIPKSGEVRRALPQGLAVNEGHVLAVSIEPPGGSPTGQPTGPVVTTATVLQAG